MVSISHSWEQKNGSRRIFKHSVTAYPYLPARIANGADRTPSPDVGDAVGTTDSVRLLGILQPRRVAMLALLCSIVCGAAANDGQRSHVVRAGDTLSKIAEAHGVKYRHLACLNDIADPNRIAVGQHIALPRTLNKVQNLHLVWPLKQGWMSSLFGPRRGASHHGIDIAAPRGTMVRAAADGRVVFSGRQNGYGKVVIVSHAKVYRTLYAHLQKSYVKVNQKVHCGQRIAAVGSSGRSTGPHLHFEVQKRGIARDPMAFLPQKTRIVLNPGAFSGVAKGGK